MKTGSGSFPLGTARDYPLYKVRGIILDVGRKTFTLDWLKQMTKQMSFYKMNDFQIHLNDNLIPLEHYKDGDVFQAYSAFRLESDVKKGGNNGKNKADLTAKDVWYSKKDFKAYIEESKALGVNIIPRSIPLPTPWLSPRSVRTCAMARVVARTITWISPSSTTSASSSCAASLTSMSRAATRPCSRALTRFTWAPTSTPPMETRTAHS